MHNTRKEEGSILVLTLVFTTIFMMLLVSLLNYLVTQFKWTGQRTEQERALQIAEAGIEYTRWHLAHYPSDIQDGTATSGPYIHIYEDPELGPIGEFSLEIGGEVLCGEVQVVNATSTGYTYKDPNITRSIVVRIARPTVADYSYVVDSNVQAGSSRTITGPYHSNGVVRMDGNNLSLVTSKIYTANCAATGLTCTGFPATVNGVYGLGTHPEWWRWGQPEIPFSNFDFDFGQMQAKAVSDGIYLPKISNDTSLYGYYLVLKNNRTVDIYEVDAIWKWVISETPGSQVLSFPELAGNNMNVYRNFLRNEPIPATCPLIYVSDRTWIEGQVSGKITVVANDTGAASPDLFLQNNITYVTGGGVDGLTVMAERNLLIPLYVPDTMTISGVFFAQKGSYGRNYYEACSGCNSVDPYDAYKEQSTLNTNGTVVSKLRTGTQWGTVQGFENRNDSYDRNLAESPPPMTPFTSPNFRFIEWQEVE